MSRFTRMAAVLALSAAAMTTVSASDRTAVYGKVDRVVLEPSTDAPETAQVWGVFSVGVPNNINDYQPAARGYLYYKLPSDKQTARREWADLQRVAGTGQIVSFGLRFEAVPTLRRADDRPASPDTYTLNTGVTKISGRTDYAPIRAVIEFKP